MTIKNNHAQEPDSYQKFANDVFKDQDDVFKHVHPQDRDDVRGQFSRLVAEADRARDLRVFPLHMTDKFKAARLASGGRSFTTQIKSREGRIYWAGFRHGN